MNIPKIRRSTASTKTVVNRAPPAAPITPPISGYIPFF